MDLGAGDARFAVAIALSQPDTLAVAVDAHPQAMADGSRRVQRRRLPNVLLVAARAEELPHELDGLADAVAVHFPWGSLLAGMLGTGPGAEPIAAGLARVVRAGGEVTAVLSITDRERALDLPRLDAALAPALAAHYEPHDLALTEWRPATAGEIADTRSSWAKRLGAGPRRPAWLLRLRRR
ncbi:MAG TPA: class I SAM-dependent methyltransferase [Candidatus Dormibacteraeota bacterium]|nr:class I SAM-dependent methyltransferase [Candidatus Dormibacteraeota bacterium]